MAASARQQQPSLEALLRAGHHAVHPSCTTPRKSSLPQLQRGGNWGIEKPRNLPTSSERDRTSIQLPAPRVPTSEAAGNVLGASDGAVCYLRETSERTCHNSHSQTVMVGEGQRATVAHASHPGNRQPRPYHLQVPAPKDTALPVPPKGCTTSQNCATSWAPRPQTHGSRLNPYPHHC